MDNRIRIYMVILVVFFCGMVVGGSLELKNDEQKIVNNFNAFWHKQIKEKCAFVTGFNITEEIMTGGIIESGNNNNPTGRNSP